MPDTTYVLGLDVGTQSLRAALVDLSGRTVAFGISPIETRYPRPTWAEQDPSAWWAAAREAVASSEAVRSQRTARHRQGLLPLTEVLDAETALSGARALLLRSQLESRLARAQLQLAAGQPVEGVTP